MNGSKKWLFPGILLLLAILIRWYAADPARVEMNYSGGWYPGIVKVLRTLLGWLPFSLGDILYGAAVLWLIYKVVKMVRLAIQKKATKAGFTRGLRKAIVLLLLVYILFNALWGINYSRKGIAFQLGLDMKPYNIEALDTINSLLLNKVNAAKLSLVSAGKKYPSTSELFEQVQGSYEALDSTYPFLQYHNRSLKTSLWGWLGNYAGFTGYYNPFTGEAQVNTSVPPFLQPFTACHEVAHQLGYAKEMEANFVGYLAASHSADTLFQYSVYLDLFLYSNRNLAAYDTTMAHFYARQLNPEVKSDLKLWREFMRSHNNPAEPVIRWMYGKYLESNQQPQGVLSYDEVTSFLIAYYRKFGKI